MNTLKELKQSIETLDTVNIELKLKKKEFEKTYSDLISKKSVIQESIRICKEILSKKGLDAYKLREDKSNKNLLGGLKIKVMSKVQINYDKNVALEWAKSHDLCLSLDTKLFETIAQSKNLEFVKIVKSTMPTVTFPKVILID
jgi:hypothetical protein